MLWIIALVFIGVFSLVALPLMGSGLVPSRSTQQALATLDSALKSETQEKRQLVLNLRKNEMLSSIPWLNERLLAFELTPYLRRLLNQAALPWSAGRLLIVSAALFVIPAYVLIQYVNSIPIALGVAVLLSLAPYGWVLFRSGGQAGFNAFERDYPKRWI